MQQAQDVVQPWNCFLLALWSFFPKISCQSEAYKMVIHKKLCGRGILISPWSLRTVNKQTESSLLWLMSIQCNSNYTCQRPLLSYHHFTPVLILKERMRKAFTPCLQILAQSHKALPARKKKKVSTKINIFKFKKPEHSFRSPGSQNTSYLQWISQRQDSPWLPLLLGGLVPQGLGWPHTDEALHWCLTLWFESCIPNQRNLTRYLCARAAAQTSRCWGAAQEMVWAICLVHWLEKPDNDNAFNNFQLALPF